MAPKTVAQAKWIAKAAHKPDAPSGEKYVFTYKDSGSPMNKEADIPPAPVFQEATHSVSVPLETENVYKHISEMGSRQPSQTGIMPQGSSSTDSASFTG